MKRHQYIYSNVFQLSFTKTFVYCPIQFFWGGRPPPHRRRISLNYNILKCSPSNNLHTIYSITHVCFWSFSPPGIEAIENLPPLSSLLGKAKGLEEKGVPRVLGVLGHTRIPIRLPIGKQDVESMMPEVKRMKEAHPDSWLNLELVCNHTGRLIHCRISKGSDLDRASALRDKLKQLPEMMPPGTCLVARVGYPASAQILTPYAVGCSLRGNLYNRSLEAHFYLLDQAVADLKARFERLRYLDMGNYERAKAVVLTACILHNVFLDMGKVVNGQVEREAGTQEGEGECDEEGVRRREAIADLLYKELDSGST